MKALCIKIGSWFNDESADSWGPAYGEEVTIMAADGDYLVLKEYYVNPKDRREESYHRAFFIPLSSIDEIEMERNFKTEKV